MRPATRYGACIPKSVANLAKWTVPTTATVSRNQTPWTCSACRLRSVRQQGLGRQLFALRIVRRQLSSSSSRFDDASTDTLLTRRPAKDQGTTLPSQTERQRWQISKQLTIFMDTLLARASVAGQHINSYTGTDYSGIDALRREIVQQERKVKLCLTSANENKTEHREAYAKQTLAQKDVVALLERKSSWSPADLEKYMSLVRSEHLNDQTVQAAKDSLAVAERELEDARSLLERLERKQYHEEQIWSDTIRRNSTWITFGLMGFNIVLLLAQITVFEPYRRRKIVRDVKVALDERTFSAPSFEVGKEVNTELAPPPTTGQALGPYDTTPLPASEQRSDAFSNLMESPGSTPPAAVNEVPKALPAQTLMAVESRVQTVLPSSQRPGSWESYKETLHDLFSERMVYMKQVDVTTIALQGAASGVAAMGLLFVLLRPR